MLSISVPSYEEQVDASGSSVTYYIVNIENAATNLKYSIIKRYSHFNNLKESLREKYPVMDTFKFPNKSYFNTHAQFTKERRRQGFDDFVKMLATFNPVPPELDDFLELTDHKQKFEKMRRIAGHQHSSNQQSVSTKSTSSASTNNAENSNSQSSNLQSISHSSSSIRNPLTQQSSVVMQQSTRLIDPNDREPQLLHKYHRIPFKSTSLNEQNDEMAKKEKLINEQIRKMAPDILKSTYTWTFCLYLLFIYLRIIDISRTTIGRMVLTVLSTGSVACFLRILNVKRQIRNGESDDDDSSPTFTSSNDNKVQVEIPRKASISER